MSEDIKGLAFLLESSEDEAFDVYMNTLIAGGFDKNDPTVMFRGAFRWKNTEKGYSYWHGTFINVLDRHSMTGVDIKEEK